MSTQNSLEGEIREQQRKLKGKSFKEKLTYFWDYYKIHTIVAVVVIIFLVVIIKDMVNNKDYGFYAAITDVDVTMAEGNLWGEDFASYAGIDLDEFECSTDTSLTLSADSNSTYSMANYEKLMVMASAGTVDVITGESEEFENLAQNGFFANLEEILPDETLEKYKDRIYYTDSATFSEFDDATSDVDPKKIRAEKEINHMDPSTMKNPVPVGIIITDAARIKSSMCYEYINYDEEKYQGQKREAVLGIPVSALHVDKSIVFIDYLFEESVAK